MTSFSFESERKYVLLDDDVIIAPNGRVCYRIKAIKDFGYIAAGQLGGYVQNIHSLSQSGNCWVADNAVIWGGGHVYEDAIIRENAQVFEKAIVQGKSVVSGGCLIGGAAKIEGTAQVELSCIVAGEAYISGDAIVRGSYFIDGKARICSVQDYIAVSGLFDEYVTPTLFSKTIEKDKIWVSNDAISCPLEEFKGGSAMIAAEIEIVSKIVRKRFSYDDSAN